MQDNDIEKLVYLLAKMPGLGKRSARRCVLHLIKNKEKLLQPLAETMASAIDTIKTCDECGNIDTISPCNICSDPRKDDSVICVVEEVSDLWAIQRASIFKGKYHVLGGTLSAMDGIGPEELNINKLVQRVSKEGVSEIIMATNATVEGQTTAHFIIETLKDSNVKISQIAHGIPIGGELEYLDDGTLGAALNARKPL